MNFARLLDNIKQLTGKSVTAEAPQLVEAVIAQGLVVNREVNVEKIDSFTDGWPENERYALLGLAIGVAGSTPG